MTKNSAIDKLDRVMNFLIEEMPDGWCEAYVEIYAIRRPMVIAKFTGYVKELAEHWL